MAGVGMTPPKVLGTPKPASSVMMSSTFGALFGGELLAHALPSTRLDTVADSMKDSSRRSPWTAQAVCGLWHFRARVRVGAGPVEGSPRSDPRDLPDSVRRGETYGRPMAKIRRMLTSLDGAIVSGTKTCTEFERHFLRTNNASSNSSASIQSG